MQLTADECLAAAWTYCAPGRAKEYQFPRGFWPDVARVAIAMFEQQSTTPKLDFRPTMCQRGEAPEIRSSKKLSRLGMDLGRLEINL